MFALCGLLLFGLGVTAVFAITAPEEDEIELPVIMYHGLLKDPKYTGKFVVTPEQFESDLAYIKERGYHTVVVEDLINYVDHGTALPEKPIMITFDDGYYNNYLYAYPLLQKYDMKMVLSIVGKYTDQYTQTGETNAYYSHVRWDDVKEMQQSGLVEIQNHSYDFHSRTEQRDGSKKRKGESEEQYKKALTEDLGKLQREIAEQTGYMPSCYTYPFGSVSNASFPILKDMGFRATLSCQKGISRISRDPECLYMLKRNLRPSGKTSADFFRDLLK